MDRLNGFELLCVTYEVCASIVEQVQTYKWWSMPPKNILIHVPLDVLAIKSSPLTASAEAAINNIYIWGVFGKRAATKPMIMIPIIRRRYVLVALRA